MEQQQQQQQQQHESPFSPLGRAVLSKGPILLSPGGSFPVSVYTTATNNSKSFGTNSSKGSDSSKDSDKAFTEARKHNDSTAPMDSISKVSAALYDEKTGSTADDANEVTMTNNDTEETISINDNVQPKYVTTELFGGSIGTMFPFTFEDVSVVRQVPDHQEVYVDKETDMSCIVELLQYDEAISDSNAAQHYFQDLAQCNEASEYSIDSTAVATNCMPCITGSYSCCSLTGTQVVAKFHRRPDGPLNNVQILLFVLRLPVVGTDILITLNVPYPQTESSIPIITTSSFMSLIPLSLDEPIAVDIMRNILKHFKIIDWSLFA